MMPNLLHCLVAFQAYDATMGRLRKHLRCLFLGLIPLLQTTPSFAQLPSTDPLYLFATCTGRFSALIEHQRLLSDPASDQTERLRHDMIDLMAAAIPDAPDPKVMQWRLEAKVAAATLLQRADFGPTPWQQATARRQINALIAGCRALLAGDGSA